MKVTRFSSDGMSQKSVELSELIESMKTEAKGNLVSLSPWFYYNPVAA